MSGASGKTRGSARGGRLPLVREVVVDRCVPKMAKIAASLGVRKIPQPPLAHTRFVFKIDAGGVGAVLGAAGNDWLPPATATAALANAIRRVFVQELPGPAITFDAEGLEGDAATFESNSGRMREDFVIEHQVKQIPLAPSTRPGLRLKLEVPKVTGEIPRTVRAGDLRLESGGALPDGMVNPEAVIAFLYPGEYLFIQGLVVTERSPEGQYPEHAAVPRCGTGPVGVPEIPVELWAAGARVHPTKEAAFAALAELAEEPFIPAEIAAKLRARVLANDTSFLVAETSRTDDADEASGGAGGASTAPPLVSLADVSRHTRPAALVATGWEVVATAKALPTGKGSCRQLAIRAASHLRAQLQRFDRGVASIGEDSERAAVRISASTTKDGQTMVDLEAPGFSKTVGQLVCTFGNTSISTISCTMRGVLQLVVAAPGGPDDAIECVKQGGALALDFAKLLEKDLAKATERAARDDEKVTTLGSGL